MEFSEEDIGILWVIKEGGTNIYMIREIMGVKIEEDKLKLIIEKLARMGLIKLEKEYDLKKRRHDWQFSIIIGKARPVLEKYKEWIPRR